MEAVQQKMEAEHGDRTQRGYAIEREGQENRERLNSLALDLDRAAARRRTNEGVARNSDASAPPERKPRSLTPKSSRADCNRNSRPIARHFSLPMPTLPPRSRNCSNGSRKQQRRLSRSLKLSGRRKDTRRDHAGRLRQSVTFRNRITQAEEHIAALDREAKRLHDETTAANQQLESFGGQRGQLGLGVRECVATCCGSDSADHRDAPSNSRPSATQKQIPSATSIPCAAEYATLMGKKGSLEGVIAGTVRNRVRAQALHLGRTARRPRAGRCVGRLPRGRGPL